MITFDECRKLESRPKITKEVRIIDSSRQNPSVFVDFLYNVDNYKTHAWFIINIPISYLPEIDESDFVVISRSLFLSTLGRNFEGSDNFICTFFFLDQFKCRKINIKFWQNLAEDDIVLADEYINLSSEFLTLFKYLKT